MRGGGGAFRRGGATHAIRTEVLQAELIDPGRSAMVVGDLCLDRSFLRT